MPQYSVAGYLPDDFDPSQTDEATGPEIQFVLLKHSTDTQEDGKREREKEWTGGEGSYSLTEKNGTTTLTVIFEVPPELEETFKVSFPKALKRIKMLTEGKK